MDAVDGLHQRSWCLAVGRPPSSSQYAISRHDGRSFATSELRIRQCFRRARRRTTAMRLHVASGLAILHSRGGGSVATIRRGHRRPRSRHGNHHGACVGMQSVCIRARCGIGAYRHVTTASSTQHLGQLQFLLD